MRVLTACQVATLIVVHREMILSVWERRVLADDAIPTARVLDAGALRGYIPKLLDTFSDEVRGESEGRLRGPEVIHLHAMLRRNSGYSLGEALSELEHLRDVFFIELGADAAVPIFRMLQDAFDRASATVMEAFDVRAA